MTNAESNWPGSRNSMVVMLLRVSFELGEIASSLMSSPTFHCGLTARCVAANVGVMNESFGLTSHNSSCTCTGCGAASWGLTPKKMAPRMSGP